MTAEMTADGVPAPVAGETPTPPVAGEGAPEVTPEEERRRRRKAILLLFLLGLLAFLITIVVWYLIFRQPINPLPVIPASEIPAYSTSIYGAQRPMGVAVSTSGDRIYVTQTAGDQTTLIFDGGGTVVGTIAPPAEAGREHLPFYVAIDPLTSEVYVSDRQAGAIYVYDRNGAYLRELALAQPRPSWQPLALTFDASGNLYVTDLSGPVQRVLVIDRQANVVRTMGENESLNFPNGVAVDSEGRVHVADSNNGRLLVFDPSGTIVARVGRGSSEGNLGLPRGVAIDGSGRAFVVDTMSHSVFVYRGSAEDGASLDYLGFFGSQGVEDGLFRYPGSVAVDARGRVYVADTSNDRVQVWSY
jgi:DNA-binding beta-propeller fold protein YncE